MRLYIADAFSHTIRKVVISTGAVSTLAWVPGVSGSSDGTGAEARFQCPGGITNDGISLYVADTTNCTVRVVAISTGEVTTLAGTASASGSDDGIGAAACFGYPCGITTCGSNLYAADRDNNTIRATTK